MKDYLVELKEELIEKHKSIIAIRQNRVEKKYEEDNFLEKISSILDIKIVKTDLKKVSTSDMNNLEINDNMIYFYPPKDGFLTNPFKFYKSKKLIIDNKKSYSQIKNLDDILLKMISVYDKALDNKIVLSPYLFMLELTNEIKKNYTGNAKLVLKSQAIKNDMLDETNFEEANSYFINEFIDHFIERNFRDLLNRNKKLKQTLEMLKIKAQTIGLREEESIDTSNDKIDNISSIDTESHHPKTMKTKTKTRTK